MIRLEFGFVDDWRAKNLNLRSQLVDILIKELKVGEFTELVQHLLKAKLVVEISPREAVLVLLVHDILVRVFQDIDLFLLAFLLVLAKSVGTALIIVDLAGVAKLSHLARVPFVDGLLDFSPDPLEFLHAKLLPGGVGPILELFGTFIVMGEGVTSHLEI